MVKGLAKGFSSGGGVPALSTPGSPGSPGIANSPGQGWSLCPLPGGGGQAQGCSCPSGVCLALPVPPRDGGSPARRNGDRGSAGTSWSGLASWQGKRKGMRKGKRKRKGKGCGVGSGLCCPHSLPRWDFAVAAGVSGRGRPWLHCKCLREKSSPRGSLWLLHFF